MARMGRTKCRCNGPAAAIAAGLFPPQLRDWALPAEVPLTVHGARRLSREAATASDAAAARAINEDWGSTLDARQVNRWARALGQLPLDQQHQQLRDLQSGIHPAAPANAPALLVIEVDGGCYQGKEKDPDTGGRWHEDKVCTVVKYALGDGAEKDPEPLVASVVASTADAHAFGPICRLEAEKRGLREAEQVLVIADGGNWIDPLLQRTFHGYVRILDYYHASEHLWELAAAIHGGNEAARQRYGEKLEGWLWNGETRKLLKELQRRHQKLGPPPPQPSPGDPRQVVAENLGYFTKREAQMDYPAYRAKGWPIGSGAVEAGVKQFNKRIKGTEQFWHQESLEPILALRGMWLSQDQRWERYWATRPAYARKAA